MNQRKKISLSLSFWRIPIDSFAFLHRYKTVTHVLIIAFPLFLPTQNVDHKLKLRSKKGQLPFVEVNGEEIADSAIIVKELAHRYEKDLDSALTLEQRLISHAMISMLENHLIWVLLFWRSKNPDLMIKGYKVNLQHALGSRLPNAVLNFLFKFQFGRKVNEFDLVEAFHHLSRIPYHSSFPCSNGTPCMPS